MWRILQQPLADDYVLATGESYSVKKFVELAFAEIGRTIEWKGSGVDEVGLDASSGDVLIEVDPRYFRPTEVYKLLGDSTKAREKLGWSPKYTFKEMVEEMVRGDLEALKSELARGK